MPTYIFFPGQRKHDCPLCHARRSLNASRAVDGGEQRDYYGKSVSVAKMHCEKCGQPVKALWIVPEKPRAKARMKALACAS